MHVQLQAQVQVVWRTGQLVQGAKYWHQQQQDRQQQGMTVAMVMYQALLPTITITTTTPLGQSCPPALCAWSGWMSM
jgi:hypothetical protein